MSYRLGGARRRAREAGPGWHLIAVFASGFILLLLLLAVAVYHPGIEAKNYNIIWTILSLACAGYAALIPGFLEIRYKRILQAGGALAVFCVIYFNAPATVKSSSDNIFPKEDPRKVAESWLRMIDDENYKDSWAVLDKQSKQRYPLNAYLDLVQSQRAPFGKPTTRQLHTIQSAAQLPTGELGPFTAITYRTDYEKAASHFEMVTVVGRGDRWAPGR